MRKSSLVLIGLATLIPMASGQTLSPAQDAHVSTAFPSQNFGSAQYLQVGQTSGAGTTKAFIQFDLSALPPGTSVTSISRVNLLLFVNRVGVTGSVKVSQATGAWSESAITSANAPATGAQIATLAAPAGQFLTIDVTTVFQAWLTTPASNFGFVVEGVGAAAIFIDSKESVTSSHQPLLQIVQAGPAGPTGLAGNTGAQGTTGATGAIGNTGVTGPTGAQGTTGVTGPTGAQGNTGITGVQGNTGATGATGSNGTNGSTGATGATGSNGTNGSTGATGATGSNGTNGSTGATGATGNNGTNGSTGATGATGSNGAAGSTGASGATGSNGAAGSTGATGATGSNGTNGSTGATGATGTNGTNGSTGSNGAAGPTGPTGPAGATGAAGGNISAASPSGIPFTVVGHNSGAANWDPGDSNQNASIVPTVMSISTTACKPAMTIYSYMNASTTFTLNSATFASGSTTGSLASTIISCATGAYSSGAAIQCSQTAGSNVAAVTPMYMTFSGGTGSAFVAFSCQ